MNNKHEWYPNIGLGNFKFGQHIERMENTNLKKDDAADDITEWISYRSEKDDIRVDFEDNVLVCITCYKQCYYNNIDLIGLSLNQLENLLQQNANHADVPVEYEDGDIHRCVDFEALGLSAWLHDNKIIYVSFINALDDDNV